MGCGVGRRRGMDLALLRLWSRPAATAPIGPLAWEPPCADGLGLKRQKINKNKLIKLNKYLWSNISGEKLHTMCLLLEIHAAAPLYHGHTAFLSSPLVSSSKYPLAPFLPFT